MIFVDTGAWFASIVPADADHAAAARWLAQNQDRLVTTDYVVDETLTLLRARGEGQRAFALGEAFFSGAIAAIHYLTEDEITDAWSLFRSYGDKQWSFTDCTSKVAMEHLDILQAFAFDRHFRQFGGVAVVP